MAEYRTIDGVIRYFPTVEAADRANTVGKVTESPEKKKKPKTRKAKK